MNYLLGLMAIAMVLGIWSGVRDRPLPRTWLVLAGCSVAAVGYMSLRLV